MRIRRNYFLVAILLILSLVILQPSSVAATSMLETIEDVAGETLPPSTDGTEEFPEIAESSAESDVADSEVADSVETTESTEDGEESETGTTEQSAEADETKASEQPEETDETGATEQSTEVDETGAPEQSEGTGETETTEKPDVPELSPAEPTEGSEAEEKTTDSAPAETEKTDKADKTAEAEDPNATRAVRGYTDYVTNLKPSGRPDGNVYVTWSPVSSADAYAVFRQKPNESKMSYIGLATVNSFLDTGAVAGFNFYRVFPYRTVGNSYELGRSIEYKYTAVVPKPVDVTSAVNYSDNYVRVTWKPSPGATEYIIYRSDVINSTGYGKYLYVVTGLSYQDLNPEGGLNIYRVIPRYRDGQRTLTGAVNDYAYSAVSPDVATGVKATAAKSGDVQVKWNASTGATDYLIFRKADNETSFSYRGISQSTIFVDKTAKAGYNTYLIIPTYRNGSINQHRPASEAPQSKTVTYPRAVTNLRVSLTGLWNHTIYWDKDPNIDKYIIYVQDPDDLTMRYLYVSLNGYHYNSFLYPGYHFYRVRPVKNIGGKDYYGESNTYVYANVPQPRNSASSPITLQSGDDIKHFIAIQTKNYSDKAYFRSFGDYSTFESLQNLLNNILTARSYFYDVFPYMPEGIEQAGGSWEMNYSYDGYGTYTLDVDISLNYHATKSQWELTKAKAREIASLATQHSSNLVQRLAYVYDWVVQNVEYAYSDTGPWADYNDAGISTHTAYSVLNDGTSVCQGYTSFLNLVYRTLGFKTFGAYSEEDSHIWTMVKIDNTWYHIDVTHGDMGYTSDYNFFLRSKANMGSYPMHTMYTNFPDAPRDYPYPW